MRRLGIIARHWGQFDLIDGSERWGGAGAAAVAAALALRFFRDHPALGRDTEAANCESSG
jgi:hypothetical protein